MASEGNPLRLSIEVMINIAMAHIECDPCAVDRFFLSPDDVTGDTLGITVCLFIAENKKTPDRAPIVINGLYRESGY